MESLGLALVACGILAFGLISGRMQKSVVTPPMAFVVFGYVLGPGGFGLVHFTMDNGLIHALAEVTLILVLFTDASRINLRLLGRQHDLPVRLLLLALPLTIGLGTLLALPLFPGWSVWTAVVLAVILAPTDAALGQAVVSSRRVPRRIRQALNVESGLNDGMMLPLLLIAVSLGCAATHEHSTGYWLRFAGLQITLGPLVGLAVGWIGGKLVEICVRIEWMNLAFQKLSAVAIPLLAFALAEQVGGNGFISAFCAGMAVGNFTRGICSRLHEFGEAEGQLLTLLVFMIFGAVLVPEALDGLGWEVAVYALLSLTVVRMLPVAISLLGRGLQPVSLLFLGWFGPRGLASILFALLVVEETVLPGKEALQSVVVITVLLSVFAHGATANPFAGIYATRLAPAEPESLMPEHARVPEHPSRIGHH